MLQGVDVSHWQGSIDWPAVRRGGFEFAILKATESTGYTDPTFAANRAKARAAGMVVGFYHFARATDPVAEADHFVSRIGSLAPGEFVVLDWEVPGTNPPAWCRAWLDRVHSRLGARALVYMNQSAARGSKWKTVVEAGYPLWLAKYDLKHDDPGVVGDWPKAVMKQYSDKGKVPGIAGNVDVNVFYGDKAALAALSKGGRTDQEENDMFGDDDRGLLQGLSWLLNGHLAPALTRIDAHQATDYPFVVYTDADATSDLHGRTFLGGPGVWMEIPAATPQADYLMVLRYLKLAGGSIDVPARGWLSYAEQMWMLLGAKLNVDTDSIVAKLHDITGSITPEEMQAIAEKVQDEEDARERARLDAIQDAATESA